MVSASLLHAHTVLDVRDVGVRRLDRRHGGHNAGRGHVRRRVGGSKREGC